MQMEKLHKITAALVLAFTTVIYLLTVAPTMSFWDCGEFIACSYKMAVPHPPGAPLFLLLGRVFSLLPIGDDIGFRVNLISTLSSSFTVLFLYLSIVHLVREWKGGLKEKGDWLTAIFSGVIGSLSFAFTHSFWFNSSEAEVYAPSMLFTALLVWLILVWTAKADKPGNERYLLMIAYVVGLALGVHLLNILAIPFVAMIYYYKKFEYKHQTFALMTLLSGAIMLFIYPGMVKYIPKFSLTFGFAGVVVFFVAILWISIWAVIRRKSIVALIFASVLLISIGYSSYSAIYIRSNLNPMIDENNPETLENFIKYMEREQYGDHSIVDRKATWKSSPNGKNYKSTFDYVWNYQINKMYVRYFLWQFVGMDDDETSVNPKQLFALPLLLGLFGIFWHFRRDPKRAWSVLALFIMTGLAIIVYLNQPDPQPRERDYSYVGSFFAFSIWIGLGFAGIMDLIKELYSKEGKGLRAPIKYIVFAVLILFVPINMLAKNYDSHNRTGNYVAWDYSYNMLMSCEPDAILFTNGDNDTFPLWYLQEVEGIRTDVRIVNLSLLNTDWYIYQLRDMAPKVPMKMSNIEIDRVGVRQWKEQKVSIAVPKSYGEKEGVEFTREHGRQFMNVPDKITFNVKPAVNSRYGGLLRTQDLMILNIVAANRWKRPVYFAVTVPSSNMLSELRNYFRMDGLVWKLVPFKNWEISSENLQKNMMELYQYRNLDNPDVYYNHNTKSLLQNYRSGFIQLAEYYVRNNRIGEAQKVLDRMDEKVDPDVIPITNAQLKVVRDAFKILADSSHVDSILADVKMDRYLPLLGEQMLRLRKPVPAERILEKAYELNPGNPRILGMLLNVYDLTKNDEEAAESLEQWVMLHPNDKNAVNLLNSIKKRLEKKN